MTFLSLMFAGFGWMLAGCGSGPAGTKIAATAAHATRLAGKIHGGQQPVTGSAVQLYAIGAMGDGTASIPLLPAPVLTDANGNFEIDTYSCPSPSSQLYIVSIAGNPGLSTGANNPNLAEMAVLGPCSSITASTQVVINEITTVAGVYSLAPYMTSYSSTGITPAEVEALNEAVTLSQELADTSSGTAPGPALPQGQVAPVQKLQGLANIVAACVNSRGGRASDGSACGDLFLYAGVTGNTPDTVQAVLSIAQNPAQNVPQIFSITGWVVPFQPSLAALPVDWTLPITSSVSAPVISPAPGTYDLSPVITMTAASPAAQIYYTTDGTPPSANSTLYTGPLTMINSVTIRAVALAAGLVSLNAQASYHVNAAHLTFATNPGTTVAGSALAPNPVVAVENSSGTVQTSYTGPVTIQLANNPSSATLSGTTTVNAVAGIATFSNLKVSAAGSGDTLSASYSGLSSVTSSSFTVTAATSTGVTYYLSPTGNDNNNGSSPASAWLSPNHSLNCGDVIVATASTAYSYTNFGSGKWGRVSCAAGNNVAWLKCASFDACKITVPATVQSFGMSVSASYWGVQGWEVNSPGVLTNGLSCFNASPPDNTAGIHHVIFADNVASTCPLAGFGMGIVAYGTASVDYYVAVGNIAYNAGTSNLGCGSGIGVFVPVASDTAAGTHIYVGGNFVWSTVNPPNCWDGNGIILDTPDGHGIVEPISYAQQVVFDNNISLSNAGVGVRVEYNNAGNGPTHAPVYVRHNTTWNNSIGQYQFGSSNCGEVQLYDTQNTTVLKNIAVTTQQGCYGAFWNPLASYSVNTSDATNTVTDNVGWSDWGYYSQTLNAAAFSFAADNLFGTNPFYANATTPGAPNCSSFSSVPACMATVVANFKPTNALVAGYGYQTPSGTPVADALFPKWICNVNLPSGLVTMGCL